MDRKAELILRKSPVVFLRTALVGLMRRNAETPRLSRQGVSAGLRDSGIEGVLDGR
jgi:hypothetical protein